MSGGGEDLAGYGARVGATLLDGLLVVVVAFTLASVALAAGAPSDISGIVVVVVVLLLVLFYAPLLMCRAGPHNGQTWGKQALCIRVVRQDAQPMTASPALLRELLGKGVLGMVPLYTIVDSLFPLGDARRQAIHDKVASTFVVRADAVPALEPAAPDPFGAHGPGPRPAAVDWAPPSTSTPSAPTPPLPAAGEPSFGEGFAPPTPAAEPRAHGGDDDDEIRGPFGPSSGEPR